MHKLLASVWEAGSACLYPWTGSLTPKNKGCRRIDVVKAGNSPGSHALWRLQQQPHPPQDLCTAVSAAPSSAHRRAALQFPCGLLKCHTVSQAFPTAPKNWHSLTLECMHVCICTHMHMTHAALSLSPEQFCNLTLGLFESSCFPQL